MRTCWIILILPLLLSSCFLPDLTSEEDLISSVEKLSSPDRKYTLYRYYVEGSMAFSSGTVRLNMVEGSDSFDPNAQDFIIEPGFISNWIKQDTIRCVKLVFVQEPHEFAPFKSEQKKWRDWIFKIDYYYANGSANASLPIESYIIEKDSIIFTRVKDKKGTGDTYKISFPMAQLSIDAKSGRITAHRLEEYDRKLIKDSLGKEQRLSYVSLTNYDLPVPATMDLQKLVQAGVFIVEEK